MAVGLTYTDQAPLVPLIQAELGITDVQAGLLPTALFLTSIGVMAVGGQLIERTGARTMNGLGVSLALLANLAFAVAPTYPGLLAAKSVGGIASGLAFVGGVRYVAGLYAGGRPHFGQGLYGAGFPLGSALGLQLLPPLALLLGGWRPGLAGSSFILVIATAVWWAWAPAVPRTRATGDLRDALGSGTVRWCFVQHAAGFGLSLAIGSWVSVYLLREFGASLVLAGLLGSLLLIAAVVMRSFGGFLIGREHVASLTIMRGAQIANLSGLALLAFPGRPLALALAGAILVGIGVALPYSAVFNTAASSLPGAPAAAQALTGMGGTFGAVIGAPIIGYAVERIGFSGAWLVVGMLPAVALAGTFLMRGEESF
ncbi:MAG TPA: MFS transporter [Candidatus Saccharimonadales bacterium]|nr:MFS transporter [Candidatus Saccharimonadales bacterium]